MKFARLTTGPEFENVDHGKPVTHQILEALGVIQMTEEWDETEGSEVIP